MSKKRRAKKSVIASQPNGLAWQSVSKMYMLLGFDADLRY